MATSQGWDRGGRFSRRGAKRVGLTLPGHAPTGFVGPSRGGPINQAWLVGRGLGRSVEYRLSFVSRPDFWTSLSMLCRARLTLRFRLCTHDGRICRGAAKKNAGIHAHPLEGLPQVTSGNR